MATPRPTPTALRLLRGDTSKGKNPIPQHEPKVKAEIPPMPLNLRDKEAKAEWKRMTKVLHGLGVLTRLDAKALAVYCDTWSLYKEARDHVRRHGVVLMTSNGNPVQNPWVAVEHRTRSDLTKALIEFGMTPASRTGVHALPDGPNDELSDFIAGRTILRGVQ